MPELRAPQAEVEVNADDGLIRVRVEVQQRRDDPADDPLGESWERRVVFGAWKRTVEEAQDDAVRLISEPPNSQTPASHTDQVEFVPSPGYAGLPEEVVSSLTDKIAATELPDGAV